MHAHGGMAGQDRTRLARNVAAALPRTAAAGRAATAADRLARWLFGQLTARAGAALAMATDCRARRAGKNERPLRQTGQDTLRGAPLFACIVGGRVALPEAPGLDLLGCRVISCRRERVRLQAPAVMRFHTSPPRLRGRGLATLPGRPYLRLLPGEQSGSCLALACSGICPCLCVPRPSHRLKHVGTSLLVPGAKTLSRTNVRRTPNQLHPRPEQRSMRRLH